MLEGYRKFIVIVLYLLSVTAVGLAVVKFRYDTLAGVGLYATGLATGVGAFVWGNVQTDRARAGSSTVTSTTTTEEVKK